MPDGRRDADGDTDTNQPEPERRLRAEIIRALHVRCHPGGQLVGTGRERGEPVSREQEERGPGNDDQHGERIPQPISGMDARLDLDGRRKGGRCRDAQWCVHVSLAVEVRTSSETRHQRGRHEPASLAVRQHVKKIPLPLLLHRRNTNALPGAPGHAHEPERRGVRDLVVRDAGIFPQPELRAEQPVRVTAEHDDGMQSTTPRLGQLRANALHVRGTRQLGFRRRAKVLAILRRAHRECVGERNVRDDRLDARFAKCEAIPPNAVH